MRIALPIVQGIVSYMLNVNLPVTQILAAQGHRLEDLTSENDEVMVTATLKLWLETIRQTNDPLLPFRIGQSLAVEQLGTLGFILRNCHSLGEAIKQLSQYNELTNDFVAFAVEPAPESLRLKFVIGSQKQVPAAFDEIYALFEFGYLQGGFSKLIGHEVKFRHVKTSNTGAYLVQLSNLMDCEVVSHQEAGHSCLIEVSDLTLPVLMPDAGKLQSYVRQAEDELAQLAGHKKTYEAVRLILVGNLGRMASLQNVAEALNVSGRVLQRRLQSENTNFKAIQEEVLRDQAIRLLKQNHTVNEVADRLGYALPSGFIRAFKGWTGHAPSVFKGQ